MGARPRRGGVMGMREARVGDGPRWKRWVFRLYCDELCLHDYVEADRRDDAVTRALAAGWVRARRRWLCPLHAPMPEPRRGR